MASTYAPAAGKRRNPSSRLVGQPAYGKIDCRNTRHERHQRQAICIRPIKKAQLIESTIEPLPSNGSEPKTASGAPPGHGSPAYRNSG
ncbi:hypothetical protein [Burkholderia singularis]|uniref:hypothetical protein n=1 Tax=Burkholderia singularis TaxID=1503053 RepID=UPI0018D406D1|nr:hypothetical protein [Burkholderia sp. Bp7605]